MDSASRKSSSLRFDLSDLFVGSLPPTSNLISGKRKMFHNFGVKSSAEYTSRVFDMSHSFKMNINVSDESKLPKKSNNLLQSMMSALGSLTHMIAKIPNYMSNINTTLSVTVVPNEGIISPEYILKNLTRRKGNLLTCMETPNNILESVKSETFCNKLHLTEMDFLSVQKFNSMPNEKLNNACDMIRKKWVDNVHQTPIHFKNFDSSYELQRDSETASGKNMTEMKDTKNNDETIETPKLENISHDINNVETSEYSKKNISEGNNQCCLSQVDNNEVAQKIPKIHDHESDIIDKLTTDFNELTNLEILMKKPALSKTSRKCNIHARNHRVKSRSKLQLRKSGVSQVKHRKEKSKKYVNCNMKDDVDTWVGEEQDLFDAFPDNCSNSLSFKDYNDFHYDNIDTKYQTEDLYDSVSSQPGSSLDDLESTRITTQQALDNSVKAPNDYLYIACDFRSRHPSESSMDSEDSCFIVFANESESSGIEESESDDNSDDEDNEDIADYDDIDDRQTNLKVRFTDNPTIHVMIKWDFAYRAARKGPWEQVARDRERFRGRVNCISNILNPVLLPLHRQKIYQNRFVTQE